MKKYVLLLIGLCFFGIGVVYLFTDTKIISPLSPQPYWRIRSIDTMKYSRDLAREKLTSKSFDEVIDQQTKNIADTGASHIGIATPYDAEFIPFLTRWVDSARKYGLKVWFRGNMSGWEKWFDHPQMTRDEHITSVAAFIKANPDLFEVGDIFSSCPECENGGPGDPRLTGDVLGYRKFLIDEHHAVGDAFKAINKQINISIHSMNYDVAKLIMDKETTKALGGIVAIDHYVKKPSQIAQDVRDIARMSGGDVFLGEYGAPIPDLHGKMSPEEQSAWLQSLFAQLKGIDELIGLNYWTSVGGSTELWDSKGQPSPAVKVVTEFYAKTE